MMMLWNDLVWAIVNVIGIVGLIVVLTIICKALDVVLCRIWDYFEERRRA